MREVCERGLQFLRVFLPLAWKYGLGLRLGSSSEPQLVLGWQITGTAPNLVTVEADSPLMTAENSLIVCPSKTADAPAQHGGDPRTD